MLINKLVVVAALALLQPFALAADKLAVVASFSILGDLVQQVGGDKVAVTTLVGADGDAHVYQPSPQDAKSVAAARVLVVNGLGFEGWMTRLASASGFRGQTVIASSNVVAEKMEGADAHDGASLDPHAWQDPARARRYVANIAAGLGLADPANAAYYQTRAAGVSQEIAKLESWAEVEFKSIPAARRRVITSHDAFGYLGRRFGISFLAPQGVSTDSEASAKEVAVLIRQIRKEKLRAVFVENISNPKLIEQIAKETGVTPGGKLFSDALSAANGPAATYQAMLKHNVTTLMAGMRLN